MASAVFAGKLTGRELTEILDGVREGRFQPARTEPNSPPKALVRAIDLEARVRAAVGPLLHEQGSSAKTEIRPGTDLRPPCDFVVLENETAKIAVEVRSLPHQISKERLLGLLGALLLWQSKGLSVWLFVPHDASEGISELQAMISDGGLEPIDIFLVGQEGVTQSR